MNDSYGGLDVWFGQVKKKNNKLPFSTDILFFILIPLVVVQWWSSDVRDNLASLAKIVLIKKKQNGSIGESVHRSYDDKKMQFFVAVSFD